MRGPVYRRVSVAVATILLPLFLLMALLTPGAARAARVPYRAAQPDDIYQTSRIFIPAALNKADPAAVVTPLPEATPPTIIAVTAGDHHTCALTAAGGVKCWGVNSSGEVGNGKGGAMNAMEDTPVDVVGLASGVQAIAAGSFHACAVTATGGLKCWGANTIGQLGDGTAVNRMVPVDVVGLTSGVKAVTGGQHFTCALTTAGGVKCWGDNEYGVRGNGQTNDDGTPIAIVAPTDVVGLTSGVLAISAGYDHTCALTTAGGVKCWGNSAYGQVGDGTRGDNLCGPYQGRCRPTPVDVVGLTSGVQAIAAGSGFTCALTTDGGVKCWGHGSSGALGDGTTGGQLCSPYEGDGCRLTPVDVVGLQTGVQAITAGHAAHSCAVTTAGGVQCWGRNYYGQLGDNTNVDRLTPVNVEGLSSGIHAIDAGQEHVCAALEGSGMKCWGQSTSGKLGNGIKPSPSCYAATTFWFCELTPADVVWQ